MSPLRTPPRVLGLIGIVAAVACSDPASPDFVTRVEVTASSTTADVDQAVDVRARAFLDSGREFPAYFEWRTSGGAYELVAGNHVVFTAPSPGTYRVTASWQDLSGHVDIEVTGDGGGG